ncbi:MAG: hypothetical protein AAFX50_26490, partial [Acidobacteriota bacterium]
MNDGPSADGPSASPLRPAHKRKAGRDVVGVEAQTVGDVTTGAETNQHVENNPSFHVETKPNIHNEANPTINT